MSATAAIAAAIVCSLEGLSCSSHQRYYSISLSRISSIHQLDIRAAMIPDACCLKSYFFCGCLCVWRRAHNGWVLLPPSPFSREMENGERDGQALSTQPGYTQRTNHDNTTTRGVCAADLVHHHQLFILAPRVDLFNKTSVRVSI